MCWFIIKVENNGDRNCVLCRRDSGGIVGLVIMVNYKSIQLRHLKPQMTICFLLALGGERLIFSIVTEFSKYYGETCKYVQIFSKISNRTSKDTNDFCSYSEIIYNTRVPFSTCT